MSDKYSLLKEEPACIELARFLANFENVQVGLGDLEAQLEPATSKEADVHRVTVQINNLLQSLPKLVASPGHSLSFAPPDRFLGPSLCDYGRTIRSDHSLTTTWTGATEHKQGRVSWTLKIVNASVQTLRIGVQSATNDLAWGKETGFSTGDTVILTIDFSAATVNLSHNGHIRCPLRCGANVAYRLFVSASYGTLAIALLNTKVEAPELSQQSQPSEPPKSKFVRKVFSK